MHVYSERDPVEIKVKDSVLSVACVFLYRKLMHAVKDSFLEDSTVLTMCEIRRSCTVWMSFPLGWRRIIPEEQRKETRAWSAERKAWEKPRLPVSICEDCTESWLAMRAKTLYNSYVFPPCMIMQIVGFLVEAFPKVFSCLLCRRFFFFWLYCSARSLSFRKLIV